MPIIDVTPQPTISPPKRGLLHRLLIGTGLHKAARQIVSSVDGATFFGPGQPMLPSAPQAQIGRKLDYPIAVNARIQPRNDEPVSFWDLYALAENHDITRLLIETRKDQVEALDWIIRVKGQDNTNKKVSPEQQTRIDATTEFLKSPDGEHSFDSWMRMLLEDMLVYDAPCVYVNTSERDSTKFEPISGTTIKRVLDAQGRTPAPPDVAFQQCYSEDTEVLTKRGWLRWNQIDTDIDEFATRNMHTKKLEWQKSKALVVRDYVGKVFNFKSGRLDLMVTPDHRMLVNRRPRALGGNPYTGGETVITAAELAEFNTSGDLRIPMTCLWEGVEVETQQFPKVWKHEERLAQDEHAQQLYKRGWSYKEISTKLGVHYSTVWRMCGLYTSRPRKPQSPDTFQVTMSGNDYCAFMGMFLSEGFISTSGSSVLIAQTPKGAGFVEYGRFLNRVFPGRVAHRERSYIINSRPLANYLRQFGHARDKFIPDSIMGATPAQIELFWHYFWLGDGAQSCEYYIITSSKHMANQFQELALKIGYWAHLKTYAARLGKIVENGVTRVINTGEMYHVSVCRSAVGFVPKTQATTYKGKVWCPSVPNGVVYVRRNGHPAWCGNCIHGIVAWDYNTDELIYKPRNLRAGRIYGCSPVQQIIMSVNIALRRQVAQLEYYTSGNIPDALIGVPETWNPDQVAAFQNYWDSVLEGDTAARRHAKFVPGGVAMTQTREVVLKDEFDEWLARVCCYAFSLPPTAFVKQSNRATAVQAHKAAIEEGLAPLMNWCVDFCNVCIQKHLGQHDLEFAWEDREDLDIPTKVATLSTRLHDGTLTINQFREKMGEESVGPEGDVYMIWTGSGPVPLDQAIKGPPPPPDPFGGGGFGGKGSDEGGGKPPFGAQEPPKGGVPPNGKGKEPGKEDASAGASDDGGKKAKPDAKENPFAKKPEPKKAAHVHVEVGEDGQPPFAAKSGATEVRKYNDDEPLTKLTRGRTRLFFKPAASSLSAEKSIRETYEVAIAQALVNTQKHVASALSKAPKKDNRTRAEQIAATTNLTPLALAAAKAADDLSKVAGESGAQVAVQLGFDEEGDEIFNQVFDRAVEYAETRSADLITMINDTTRKQIRDVIASGLDDGQTMGEIAGSLAEAYAFSADRAALIASTEIANGNSVGALYGMQEAADAGVSLKKVWIITDEETCELCQENADAGPIDLDDEFPSGDTEPLGHPRCRCVLGSEVDDDTVAGAVSPFLRKYNENHDELGRFSSGDGGGSGQAPPALPGLPPGASLPPGMGHMQGEDKYYPWQPHMTLTPGEFGDDPTRLYNTFADKSVTGAQLLAQNQGDQARADVVLKALSEGTKTIESRVGPDGKFTAEARARQDGIVAGYVAQFVGAMPTSGQQPELIMLGGRGGSGKSWLTNEKEGGPINPKGYVKIDSDEIKAGLGSHGWDGALYHDEADIVIGRVEAAARAAGVNVIYDAAMKTSAGVQARLDDYQKAGYTAKGYYMFTPPQVAATNAIARWRRDGSYTGRFVLPDVILNNKTNEASFQAAKSSFADWHIYTNMSGRGPKGYASKK